MLPPELLNLQATRRKKKKEKKTVCFKILGWNKLNNPSNKKFQVLQHCYNLATFIEKVLFCTKNSEGAKHVDKVAIKQPEIAAAQTYGEYTCSQFVTIQQLLLWPSSFLLGL